MDGISSELILRALDQEVSELRAAQVYSQEGFADKCGVHRTFMGTVERGESNLSFSNIARMAAALEMPISTLILGAEVKAQVLAVDAARAAPAKGGKPHRATKRAR